MKKGKLKIYFGYCDGVRKTYAMLNDASSLLKQEKDIVVGYINSEEKDVLEKIQEFETIPLKSFMNDNQEIFEFNVEAAIKRNPEIILLDNLAYKSSNNLHSVARYVDVIELLNNGIDVWVTLNFINLESVNTFLKNEFNEETINTIPDEIFDNADEVKLVDIDPRDVYKKKGNCCKEYPYEKLVLLRELCLKRTVERLNKNNKIKSQNNILVLISPSPSSSNLISVAAKMASVNNSNLIGLYISNNSNLSQENQNNLEKNISLIKDLGGSVVIKYSKDLIEAISNFVSLNNIKTMIIGKSWQSILRRENIENRIIKTIGDTEILIIPNKNTRYSHSKIEKIKRFIKNCSFVFVLFAFLISLISFVLDNLIGGIISLISIGLIGFILIIFNIINAKYKERLEINTKLIDDFDYILKEVENLTGEEKNIHLAKAISKVFSSSLLLKLSKSEYKVKANEEDISIFDNSKEKEVQEWVLSNNVEAGNNTKSLIDSDATYFPLNKNNELLGLIGFLSYKNKFDIQKRLLFYKILPLIVSLIDDSNLEN